MQLRHFFLNAVTPLFPQYNYATFACMQLRHFFLNTVTPLLPVCSYATFPQYSYATFPQFSYATFLQCSYATLPSLQLRHFCPGSDATSLLRWRPLRSDTLMEAPQSQHARYTRCNVSLQPGRKLDVDNIISVTYIYIYMKYMYIFYSESAELDIPRNP